MASGTDQEPAVACCKGPQDSASSGRVDEVDVFFLVLANI